MAQIIIQNGGSGGGKSDDCTALKEHVIEDYTAITQDSDDEIVHGTLKNHKTDTSYTGSSFVWSNSYIVDIPKGAYIRQDLGNAGGRISMPLSKVATDGGVTAAKLLQGQSAFGINGTATSDANAIASNILSGKTAYVKGSKITGTMAVSSVVSFKAAPYSTSQVLCTWTNPSKGPYSGFAICAKTGSYPTSHQDSRVYTGVANNQNLGAANSIIIGGLVSGTTYYFRIWVYCNTSTGYMYSGYQQATATTVSHGRVVFTSSGTWTVPANVYTIDIHCTGGGKSGNGSNSSSNGGAAGTGARTSYQKGISVSPGQVVNFTVGSGGKRGSVAQPGSDSIATIGSVTITAKGGHTDVGGGQSHDSTNKYGGRGGSDGGPGYQRSTNSDIAGGLRIVNEYSTVQGTTTREFGESSGTLYCGGGGGEGFYSYQNGAGGAGGGGAGGSSGHFGAQSGTTGSGGGGGDCRGSGYGGGDGGSGNVVIRW